MMIFRAIFWIGLVSLLMPREPDIGLGRPGAGISLPAMVKSWGDSSIARAENIAAAAISRLAKEQKVTAELAAGAFRDLGIDPNKPDAAKA